MKKFTVADFIAYNNPCFNCGEKINFKFGFFNPEPISIASYLRPTVTAEQTEIDLVITYSDAVKLCISHKTNKITTNNPEGLTKYLSSHKLWLQSICSRCLTEIGSRYLEINQEKSLIQAVGLFSETLIVSDNNNYYRLESYFADEKSTLIVDRLDSNKIISPTILNLPLLPKYRFKNKQHFLEKIKTYLLFS